MNKIKESVFNCRGKLFKINYPAAMGIVNITSDSFHVSSRVLDRDPLLKLVEKHLFDGAQIIDLGASSSRPGSVPVPEEIELKNITQSIQWILSEWPECIISVDSWRAKVADEAIHHGAKMVNDISAGNMDPEIVNVIANHNCPYIIMHMKETPLSMNLDHNLQYSNISSELIQYFAKKMNLLHSKNIHQIIIDPGFGFSKNNIQNFTLLKELSFFSILETPIMIGISRKSMIQKTLGIKTEAALNGTTAGHALALSQGAHILRVHDVKEAVETIKIYQAYQTES